MLGEFFKGLFTKEFVESLKDPVEEKVEFGIKMQPEQVEQSKMVSGINIQPVVITESYMNSVMHPNDPRAWEQLESSLYGRSSLSTQEMMRRERERASMYYRPMDLPIPQNIMNQRRDYAYNYINNRGPVSYSGYVNPMMKSSNWNEKFVGKVNTKTNEPEEFAKKYYTKQWEKDRYDKVTGMNIDEAYRRNNYQHIKEVNEQLQKEREQSLSNQIGKDIFSNVNDRIDTRAARAEGINTKRNSVVTPSIPMELLGCKEDGSNIIDADGEPAFLLSASQDALMKARDLELHDRAKAYNAAMKGYVKSNADYLALAEAEHPSEDDYDNEMEYEDGQYLNFGGYQGSYYDNNRFITPPWIRNPYQYYNWNTTRRTKEELESGTIPFVVNAKTKDIVIKEKEHLPVGHIDNPKEIHIGWSTYTKDKDGNEILVDRFDYNLKRKLTKKEIRIINEKSKQLRESAEKYLEKKDLLDQMRTDDSYRLANELSRYSEEAASLLLWSRTNISKQNYDILKKAMVRQLLDYRNNDPLASIKSNVSLTGDRIVIYKNKDYTDEEVEAAVEAERKRARQYLHEEKLSDSDRVKRALKQLDVINPCKSPKEIVIAVRKLKDIPIIPVRFELYRKYRDAIINALTPIKMTHWREYNLWRKNLSDTFTGVDAIEKFDKWWNSPIKEREQQNQFRPYQSTQNTPFDYFMKLLDRQPEFERIQEQRRERSIEAFNRIDNGQIGNAKTFDEYNDAVRNFFTGLSKVQSRVVYRREPARNLNFDRGLYKTVGVPYTAEDRGRYWDNRQTFMNSIYKPQNRGLI